MKIATMCHILLTVSLIFPNARITTLTVSQMSSFYHNFTDVAETVFLKCMTANQRNPEHKEYKVTFNYEFLDDTYSYWGERGSSDPGSGTGKVFLLQCIELF